MQSCICFHIGIQKASTTRCRLLGSQSLVCFAPAKCCRPSGQADIVSLSPQMDHLAQQAWEAEDMGQIRAAAEEAAAAADGFRLPGTVRYLKV